MDPLTFALLALFGALVALSGSALFVQLRPSRLGNGQPVIVCTRRPDDQSLHGVVLDDTRAGITLASTYYLPPSGDPVAVGQVFVPRESIAFVQVGVAPVEIRSGEREGATPRPSIPLPDTRRPARLREAPAPAPERVADQVGA